MLHRVISLIALVSLAGSLYGQTTVAQNPLVVIRDNPSITITTGSATTTTTPSSGAHEVQLQWIFGTVVGTYSGCTVQLVTAIDNATFATLGSATAITVATGQANIWIVRDPGTNGSVSATAAQSFGQMTKATFACSSYGVSAPVTINVIYRPTPTAPVACNGGAYDSGFTPVPTSYPVALTSVATCVTTFQFVNTTASPIWVSVRDGSGNYYVFEQVVPVGQPLALPFNNIQLSGGIQWFASSSGLAGQVKGFQ